MTKLGAELQAGGGQVFGSARIVVDAEAGECILVVSVGEPFVPKRMHLHSLDEIRGAYSNFVQRSDAVSQDAARALKFAGLQIRGRERK